MRKRNATTLIEVIGTIGVLLLLAVSAASILGAITEIGVRDGRAKQGRVSVQRLADVLRRDVHDASSITLSDEPWPLDLNIETSLVRYEWDKLERTLRRTVRRGDAQIGADQFQLSADCDPQVAVSDQRVTVLLNPGQKASPWVIEANRQ